MHWAPFGLVAAETSGDLVAGLRRTFGDYLGAIDVRWELVHHCGDPGPGLERIAAELRADCIVVGRGGVARFLVTAARRPVVVVP